MAYRMVLRYEGAMPWESDAERFEQSLFSSLLIYGINLIGVDVSDDCIHCKESLTIQEYCKSVAARYGRPYTNLATFIFELKQGYYERNKRTTQQN